MSFKRDWQGLKAEEKRAFARAADTTVGYLSLIAGGHRKAGPKLAERLVAASGNVLQLEDLRPDWARVGNASAREARAAQQAF